MHEITDEEACKQLSEFLQVVEQGETVAITRNGKPIAHLVPVPDQDRIARKEAVNRFLRWRANQPPTDITLEEILAWRHEGHRF
jgi:prevent-host-death family protein